jgi:hypothetical protein
MMKHVLLFLTCLFAGAAYGQSKDVWVSSADESQTSNVCVVDIIQIKNNGNLVEFFLVGQSGIRTKVFESHQGYKSAVSLPTFLEQNADWVQVENNPTCITYLNLRHITGFRNYSHGNGLVGVIVRVNEFDDAYRIGGDNLAIKRLRALHQPVQCSAK